MCGCGELVRAGQQHQSSSYKQARFNIRQPYYDCEDFPFTWSHIHWRRRCPSMSPAEGTLRQRRDIASLPAGCPDLRHDEILRFVPYAQQGPREVLQRLRGQVFRHPLRHDDLRHHGGRAALDADGAALRAAYGAGCPRGAQRHDVEAHRLHPGAARRRRVHRLVVARARAVAWRFRLLVLGARCDARSDAFERSLVPGAVGQLGRGTN